MARRRGGSRTYVRFDDNYDENPKIAALSDAAFRVHVSAVCYCGRNLTDGRIPVQIARKLGPPRAIRELVAAGLFVETETGFEVHDYLEHQRSADQVKDLVRKRQEAGSRGGTAKANNLATGVASATSLAQQTGSNGVPEDRGQRTEKEKNTPPTPPRGGENGTAKTSRRQPSRPLPDGFAVTAQMREWHRSKGITDRDADRQTEKFIGHARATDRRLANWEQGWRNWLTEAVDRGQIRGAHLTLVDGEGVAQPSLSREQIEEILGPDYWQCPQPPAEHWDNPLPWQREQIEKHRAERVREALERLRDRQLVGR